MKDFTMTTFLITILCLITSYSCLEADAEADDTEDVCQGITPDNFNSILYSTGVSDDLLPVLRTQQCFCKGSGQSKEPCSIQCHPCDKNPDRCQIMGTCCSSSRMFGNSSLPLIQKSLVDVEVNSSQRNLMCYDEKYLVLKSCPVGYHDEVTLKLCEGKIPLSEMTIEKVAFVTDESNNASYANKYCAKCNNVQKVKEWRISVECETYFYVLDARNEEELLRLSLDPSSTCTFKQYPDGFEPYPCDNYFYLSSNGKSITLESHLKLCNPRGIANKLVSDQLLRGCEEPPDNNRMRVVSGKKSFKNIYCLMCHAPTYCPKLWFEKMTHKSSAGSSGGNEEGTPIETKTESLGNSSVGGLPGDLSDASSTGNVTGVPTGAIPGGPTGGIPGVPTGAIPGGPTGGIPGVPTGVIHGGPTGGIHGGPTGGVHGGPTGGMPGGPTGVIHGGPTGGIHGGPTGGVHGGPTGGMPGGPTGGTHGGPTGGIHGGPIGGIPGGPTGGIHGGPTGGMPGGPIGDDPMSGVVSGLESILSTNCKVANESARANGTAGTVGDLIMYKPPPFQFMFGLGGDGFTSEFDPLAVSECQSNQWEDRAGNCRQVLCTEGKVLKGDRCVAALSMITGLPYRISLLLTYLGHHNYSDIDSMSWEERYDRLRQITLQEQIEKQIQSIAISFSVVLYQVGLGIANISDNKEHTPDSFYLAKFIVVNINIITVKTTSISRDGVENKLLDIFFKSPLVDVPYGNDSFQYQSVSTMFTYFGTDLEKHEFEKRIKRNLINFRCTSSYQWDEATCRYVNFAMQYDLVEESSFIKVMPYLRCPHVKFFAEEINYTVDDWPVPHASIIVLDLGLNTTVEITEPDEINQIYRGKNGTFLVCLELLKLKFASLAQPAHPNNLFDVIQHVLTGVCVAASLMCLSATITTYCLFRNLRCVAGCNTLGLSVSLFVSQLLLLVGNTVQGPSLLCTATGVTSHYSWLVMFTWTFLCCLHMLRVFTSVKGHSKATPKSITFNVMVSFLVPASIVGVIVVINVVTTHATTIGYGSYSCGVDNVYTIYAPLIFVNVSNVVFFAIVVIKIWSVRRLQRANESRKDFIVYVKLSTLTGMFWLLVILGEVFRNDVIRCLAILTNGSQGVFIFASFTANRRVAKYYSQRFNFKSFFTGGAPSSTAQSSTKPVMTSKGATFASTDKSEGVEVGDGKMGE